MLGNVGACRCRKLTPMTNFGSVQEADLVLGGDEGKDCTYKKGYMKRQAVFSCLTCTPSGDAGFCTACSLACHDGHEVCPFPTTFRMPPYCMLSNEDGLLLSKSFTANVICSEI